MDRLDFYADAVAWLEEAALESKKTDNVDVDMLITNCKNTLHCVQILLPLEQDLLKVKALSGLSTSLESYLEAFHNMKKKFDGIKTPETDTDSISGNENSQCKRRKIAIKDTILEKGNISFCDVVGLTHAKQALKEALIMPLQYPHLFTGGRQPWRRILLYGPPGTGKTRLAQAVASEIESVFYSVSSSDLVSSWVGESEKLIKELFHNARKEKGQSVIFIDEIDSICRKRSIREEEYTRRIKTELLKQMEGANHSSSLQQFILLCATNCPWELDTAFLRRFQKRIYIPLPEKEERIKLMQMHLAGTPSALSAKDWCILGEQTKGLSGSDLSNCTVDAMFEPMRELEANTSWKLNLELFYDPCLETEKDNIQASLSDLPPEKIQPRAVNLKDFLNVLSRNTSTVTEEDIKRFEQFTVNLGYQT
ncbi:PREDICTED: protein SUPPRESSOR OF K(+) TRANSPORT GROWTH DEFECT 1-like isoform X1 [Acropora digitifera]|uniref:protein SUPPRESSOR OF K(+) TRANSPORT GROWTH DEFECT 1-like isoform X1 n=2 Tax=Acropora digitifera TaxID=70779 RepID=UPI00077A5A4A|nr:PREDICTED: protein SUPPRESSOR OF K(+) TRANSPORT GROWTH DEFECT 1-like isoform X1 [Acropora digitifera]